MKAITAPLLLAAAVGVPYAATHTDEIEQMWQSEAQTEEPQLPSLDTFSSRPPVYGVPQATGQLPAAPTARSRSISLAEVIRFDVTKNWVFQRWQRKTTSLAELGLFGVRVPLVTGTSLQDMAGSLTYYFDSQGAVRRISLIGTTGNTTQLEALVTRRYGLQMQGTAITGQRIYQLRHGNVVIGELVIRTASVLRSNVPHESFNVELQLQRPGTTTPLPAKAMPLNGLSSQQPQPAAVQQAAAVNSTQSAAEKPQTEEDETSDEPFWRAYMPRSRVPEEQIENLERRGRF